MGLNKAPKIKWRNFWICFSIALGQVAFGYPSSIIGTTLGQPAFLLYMRLITPEGVLTPNANNLIGATSGVFQVWQATSSYDLADHYRPEPSSAFWAVAG